MNLNLRIISILSIFIVAAFVIGSACAAPALEDSSVASDSQVSTLGLYPGCLDSQIRWGCSNPTAGVDVVAANENVVADENAAELSSLIPDRHVYLSGTLGAVHHEEPLQSNGAELSSLFPDRHVYLSGSLGAVHHEEPLQSALVPGADIDLSSTLGAVHHEEPLQ